MQLPPRREEPRKGNRVSTHGQACREKENGGIWVLCGCSLQCSMMFETFHNKILGKKGKKHNYTISEHASALEFKPKPLILHVTEWSSREGRACLRPHSTGLRTLCKAKAAEPQKGGSGRPSQAVRRGLRPGCCQNLQTLKKPFQTQDRNSRWVKRTWIVLR